MNDTRPLAIALMGPTASGKTALAIEWAKQLQTEVISVDSALVYRGMDIGSAKPGAEEQSGIPHHLIDIRDPWQIYSAADFAKDAMPLMDQLSRQNKIPLLVGGTGLYFRALLDGLSDMPAADEDIRADIQAQAEIRGWPAMHEKLRQVDEAAGVRIKPNDVQRITRALEVFQKTGIAISKWQQDSVRKKFPYRVLRICIAPHDRAVLHERIARRFDLMLEQGFLAEMRTLMANSQLHLDLPSMRAVGYRQAWRHLIGETNAEQFREEAIAATRQLAKRQLTWFRGELDLRWFDPHIDRKKLENALALFITR
ncbi:MAG: tRNA (adenosine(37)-N6)-dimethylallyltransferase MiaA [Chakrabartia sp.]